MISKPDKKDCSDSSTEWGGNMQRILRLSLANIKKHRMQAILLALLILCCIAITGAALSGQQSIRHLFPDVVARCGLFNNCMLVSEKEFNDTVLSILEEDERVLNTDHLEIIWSTTTNYLDDKGDEKALYMGFTTEDMAKRIQKFAMETTLSEAEIRALEHPIYMPFAVKDNLHLKAGDTFDMIHGTRRFSFTVAGFYEAIFLSDTNNGCQMLVSDADYLTLRGVLSRHEMILYNTAEGCDTRDVANRFLQRIDDVTGRDVSTEIIVNSYDALFEYCTTFTSDVTSIMLLVAVVILLTSGVMILFRISGDIQDQIQSIGVLEALGYTSGQITLAYAGEYLLLALAGVLPGTAGAFALLPVLFARGEMIAGHHADLPIIPLPILLTASGILLFVFAISYLRAMAVRNYPPVQAFRKGIAAHHFGKNYFPLRKTGSSVHLRLAMKGFVQNLRQSTGLFVCVTASAAAVVLGLLTADTFRSDMEVAKTVSGAEICDILVFVSPSADAAELAEEISLMPGVRKVNACNNALSTETVYSMNHTARMVPLIYDDFGTTECILTAEGRLPEHDNEVVVSKLFASDNNLKTGGNLTLEKNGVEKNYIITGIASSVTNGGKNLCITTAGIRRLIPVYRHRSIDIFLDGSMDKQTFKTQLLRTYGQTISDLRREEISGETLEERIRSQADSKMAELMNSYGVTHIEYAVQVGDTMISGGSSGFQISSVCDLAEILETQMGAVFSTVCLAAKAGVVVIAAVVLIIIVMMMEQTVRRQRRELGIMLGLGYTTRELMLQLTCRIMPAAAAAVILGTALGTAAVSAVFRTMIGTVLLPLPLILASAVIMTVFCFGCAYIGAGRIRKISVTELMTE